MREKYVGFWVTLVRFRDVFQLANTLVWDMVVSFTSVTAKILYPGIKRQVVWFKVHRRFRTRYFHHLPLWRKKHTRNVGRSVGLHGVTSRINNSPIISLCAYHFLSPSASPFPPKAQQLLVGQGLLTDGVTDHTQDAPHSVGLLWTSDQPFAEISTWQHTALTRERHPWPGGNRTSNPS